MRCPFVEAVYMGDMLFSMGRGPGRWEMPVPLRRLRHGHAVVLAVTRRRPW